MSELGQKLGIVFTRRGLPAVSAVALGMGLTVSTAEADHVPADERYLPFGDRLHPIVRFEDSRTHFGRGTVFSSGRVELGEPAVPVFPFITRIDREGVKQLREKLVDKIPANVLVDYSFTPNDEPWVQTRQGGEYLVRVGLDHLVREGVFPRYSAFDLTNPSTLSLFARSVERELLSWLLVSADLYGKGTPVGSPIDLGNYLHTRRPENLVGVEIESPIRVTPQIGFDYRAHYSKNTL